MVLSMTQEPLLYTIPEAMSQLACGRSMLYDLIARGELVKVHLGASARVPAASVRELVARKVAEATEAPLPRPVPLATGRRHATR